MRFRLVVAACGHLRESAELFRSLGAQPWADRAENELRAAGETARKRDPSTLDQLTPQELQIAGLVASGLINREIASQLFLSPRTVEYHLRKVFAKLGLASRIELIRRGDTWNSMVTHRVRIRRAAEVDQELLGWLERAYAIS